MDHYSSTLSLITALLIGLLVSVAYFWWDTAAGRSDLDVPGGDQRRATAFEKVLEVLLWMMVLALTVFVGGMIGMGVGGATSSCHDQGCFAPAWIGFLAGAGVGLLVVIVAFAIYKIRRVEPDVPLLRQFRKLSKSLSSAWSWWRS